MRGKDLLPNVDMGQASEPLRAVRVMDEKVEEVEARSLEYF